VGWEGHLRLQKNSGGSVVVGSCRVGE
jgi:hypothetical protein